MASDLKLSRKASVEDFKRWGIEIENECRLVQAVASSPNEFHRDMRLFRYSDVYEFTGISRGKWRQWIKDNEDLLNSKPRDKRDYMISISEYRKLLNDFGYVRKRPAGAKPMRLLTQAFKGGSQKSSLSLHVAQYLCLKGHRVLCVDTDPQGSLTRLMGFSPQFISDENTIGAVWSEILDSENPDGVDGGEASGSVVSDALVIDSASDEAEHYEGASENVSEDETPEGVEGELSTDTVDEEEAKPKTTLKPLPTHFAGMDLLPANLAMTGADIDIAATIIRQKSDEPAFYVPLTNAFEEIEDNYDVIIIDSPPAFSFMGICLAWYANALLVPVPAEVPDLAATGDFCELFSQYLGMTESWEDTKKSWDPVLFAHGRISGTEASKYVQQSCATIFKNNYVKAGIKQSKPVINSMSSFKSVFESSSSDIDRRGLKQARDMYMELGKEVEDAIVQVWDDQANKSLEESSNE